MSEGAGITRRSLLGTAAGGLAVGAGGALVASRDAGAEQASETVPYFGAHQAGIVTPAQDRLHFAAFDMTTRSVADLRGLMCAWTVAAARMTAGKQAGRVIHEQLSPPEDTGEAIDLPASNLTVTIGFGPKLFDGRFGLAGRKPDELSELRRLPGDELDPDISGGDLCVQACADDPQVAFHAVRNLTRIANGVAVMRWCQLGFGRTSKTTDEQQTPRNLMGFKDGTNNITAQETAALDRFVWVGSEGPAWIRGGSYLVTRRIRMLIESWDRSPLQEQEQTIGRGKYTGAPLGSHAEHDTVHLDKRTAAGTPAIPVGAHIRLANPANNSNQRILRRGYSFTDGFDSVRGQLDAGLFFIAFQRDPEKQFAAIQRKLGRNDALNEYIQHTSSAVFAVPAGVRRGQFIGQGLFD